MHIEPVMVPGSWSHFQGKLLTGSLAACLFSALILGGEM